MEILFFLCIYGVYRLRFFEILCPLILLLCKMDPRRLRISRKSEKHGHKRKELKPNDRFRFFWRKRWDSNPRAREDYLISSQPRYDRFDTSPYIQTSTLRSAQPFGNRGIETRDVTITIQFELPDFPCGSKGVQGTPDQLTVGFRVISPL